MATADNRRYARRACKPDSVPGFPPSMTIPLGRASPRASCCQPDPSRLKLAPRRSPVSRTGPAWGSYSALLPVGLAVPGPLPAPRWALAPPFHPCRASARRSVLCGAFRRVSPPGRYPAPSLHGVRTFLEPFGPRPSGPPRIAHIATRRLRYNPRTHFILPEILRGLGQSPNPHEVPEAVRRRRSARERFRQQARQQARPSRSRCATLSATRSKSLISTISRGLPFTPLSAANTACQPILPQPSGQWRSA